MRLLLIFLLFFSGLSAIVGGSMMIVQPEGHSLNLSTDLLASTPFRNFLLPGILLAVVVGGMNMLALFFNMARHSRRYDWSLAAGIILSAWVIMQMILMGTANGLHLLYLLSGVIVVLVSWQLKGKWAV